MDLFLLLIASGLGGLIIFANCRLYYRGVPISHQLDGSLIPATMISTLVFVQAGPWPALSILLVVILSVVHFRTVIKDMTDMIFVFWAVAAGVLTGAGIPLQTLVLDVVGTLICLIIISRHGSQMFGLLMVRYEPRISNELLPILQQLKGKIRSQIETDGLIDISIEVHLRDIDLATINRIATIDGVKNAFMISNDGNANP